MKILYILNRFPALSETFILNEIVALIQSGQDVSILSLHRPQPGPVHDRVFRYDLLNKTGYLDLPVSGAPSGRFRAISNRVGMFLTDRRLTLAQKFRLMPLLFRKTQIRSILDRVFLKTGTLPETMQWIRQNRFDHIHCHFASWNARIAYVFHKVLGVSYTLTTHAYDIFTDYEKDAKLLLDSAKRVVAISEFNKNYMHNRFGIPRSKMDTVYYGIDFENMGPAPAYSVSPLRILSVSRLVPKKGLEYLIEACKLLKTRGVPFTCEIWGEGPMRPVLEKHIREKGLEAHIKLGGAAANEKVLQLIRECSVFVLPCVKAANQDMDGIPFVLMEAMALEIPVVSTDITGIPELIETGVDGVLVPQRDAFRLAEAMMKIAGDTEFAGRIRKAGRQKVAAKFESRKNAAKLIESFRK